MSPDTFGRVDLAKYKLGCSTLRNCFVSYRGGAYSRAGSKFIGQAFQNGSSLDYPVLIPFSFSQTQAYVLEVGNTYFRFIRDGAYITEAGQAITIITAALPSVFTVPGHGYSNTDWVQLNNINGIPEISGQVYIVTNATTNTFQLSSTLTGLPLIVRSLYTGGGTAARIYTLQTPYLIADVPMLKWAQSADVMTITHNSYPPADLARHTDASWSLTVTTFQAGINPPPSSTAFASNTTASNSTSYAYEVTAVSSTGEESVASPIALITDSVDTSVIAGTNTVGWAPVTGASYFNIYRAPPALSPAVVPIGSSFGFIGNAFGLNFADTNIIADSTMVPPTHTDPFAEGAVIGISMSSYGSGILTASGTVITATGTGFSATPVIQGGEVQWWIIGSEGQGYTAGDTLSISATYTSSGSTTSASGTIILGPTTGTWPGCVAYFQQRRFYANTINNPDTYYASKPGAYTNMDTSIPAVDDDAIVGTPWAQQVDGIQFMVPMPGGLVILTGKSAWQLSGGGGVATTAPAITPSNQFASPQAYNGSSALVHPLTINYDILYVQEKGSIVRDLSYNFFVSIYTGTDLTVLSNHLFTGYTITRWDWAEEPYKLVWAVRNDGVLLCLTYLKEQDVYAWSRHDTQGSFVSVACISEPPVNATYVIVRRAIYVNGQDRPPDWAYYVERFDNRIWTAADNVWCVDCGLSLSQPAPNATLSSDTATGVGWIGAYQVVDGGGGYTNPAGHIVAPVGSGASQVFTVVDGVITAVTAFDLGFGYFQGAHLVVTDSTGSGAVVQPIIWNRAIFTADAPVFSAANLGDVIRMGGGIATVVEVIDTQNVVGQYTIPITVTVPNDALNTPRVAPAGTWTITTPVQTVHGLDYLEGMIVSVLADGGAGGVFRNFPVINGSVVLPQPASSIVVGLEFDAQLQTMYLEAPGGLTVQGRRKNIYNMTVRVVNSRGWEAGANQPDASTQPYGATVPWTDMVEMPQREPAFQPGVPIPLLTGDTFTDITAGWAENAQVAVQQRNPLPLQVVALIPNLEMGDSMVADE